MNMIHKTTNNKKERFEYIKDRGDSPYNNVVKSRVCKRGKSSEGVGLYICGGWDCPIQKRVMGASKGSNRTRV